MAARKSSRRRPEPVQVDLDLDFGGPPPSLTGVPLPMGERLFVRASAAETQPVERSPVERSPVELSSAGAVLEKPAVPSDGAGGRSGVEAGAVLDRPKVWTVTQLTKQVRRHLEREFGHVWVEGELSNVRRQGNGHAYFTLKDAGSQLSCVLFRGQAHAGMPEMVDGLQVQVGGEISVYEPRGQYQLIVHEMQAAGVGALQAKFEALKRRLAADGLFDAARKRPLPKFPSCLGLVTSPSGAAVRDMLTILARRAPWVRVVIWPVRVQGEGAAAEIAAAVRQLGDAPRLGLPQPDVLIVGRGGGSMEDLWCFNEEVVARALAESPVPTVSAVGHEIDFTIADFAADHRALTPSAAAEMVVPDRAELHRRLEAQRRSLTARAREALHHARTVVDFHLRGPLVREPRRGLELRAQQLDDGAAELVAAVSHQFARHRDTLATLDRRLAALRPAHVLAQRAEGLEHLRSRLEAACHRQIEAAHSRWQRVCDLLRSLGPQAVLSRGYSLTLAPSGQPLMRATQVRPGDRLTTRLADGLVESVVAASRRHGAQREPS